MNYLLVFDTNALFKNYERCPDFTEFSFNGTFDHFVQKIEGLDIYDLVSIAVPQIVWKEMRKQNISGYNKKVEEFEKYIKDHKFPFHSYQIDNTKKYSDYLDQQITDFKNSLKNRPINIEELNFPSDRCYIKLINRAYEKRPPFEGKDKSSDKGFKDALLWESILEYKVDNPNTNIILYTNDHMFNDEIKKEYTELFSGQEILIVGSETENILNAKLDQIAKEKDITYPISKYSEEYLELKEYLYSADIYNDIQEFSKEIIGDTKYLHLGNFKIKEIYNIEHTQEDEAFSEYEVMVKAEVTINTDSISSFTDDMDMTLWISSCDDFSFSIEEIHIDTEDSEENNAG